MFDPAKITEKIFANKVRNKFPTDDIAFEFGRLQDEVKELEEALCNGAPKELCGEFADVAIFSMAIAKMKNVDAEGIFASRANNQSMTGDVPADFAAFKKKVKKLERALEHDSEKAICDVLAQVIGYLAAIARVKGIDLEAAIQDKVAYNAIRVYTKM